MQELFFRMDGLKWDTLSDWFFSILQKKKSVEFSKFPTKICLVDSKKDPCNLYKYAQTQVFCGLLSLFAQF